MAINVDKLFDFIGVIFADNGEYEKLNNNDKSKHFFMTNRFFSISFPIQACSFSNTGMNPAVVCDCWRMIGKRYKRVPGWIYTKTKSSTKKDKKIYVPSEEAIEHFLLINEIGIREYKDSMRFNSEKTLEILRSIDDQIEGFRKEKR